MSYLAKEIMENQGKNSPIGRKHHNEEWRRRIRIAVQNLEEGEQRTHQDNLDRRYKRGYGAPPGSLRLRSPKRQWRLIQNQNGAESKGISESQKEQDKL